MFDVNHEAVVKVIEEASARLEKVIADSGEAVAQVCDKTKEQKDINAAADKAIDNIETALKEIKDEIQEAVAKCLILHDKVFKIANDAYKQMYEYAEDRIAFMKKVINY